MVDSELIHIGRVPIEVIILERILQLRRYIQDFIQTQLVFNSVQLANPANVRYFIASTLTQPPLESEDSRCYCPDKRKCHYQYPYQS